MFKNEFISLKKKLSKYKKTEVKSFFNFKNKPSKNLYKQNVNVCVNFVKTDNKNYIYNII